MKPKFVIHYYSIRVTFGFAKTVHKSQSLTEDTALMDLNERPNGILGWTLRKFFVAYTRVKSNDDLRVLKPITGNFNHLMKFRHDSKFVHWLAGFQEGECWDVAAAKASFEKDYKSNCIKRPPLAARGKPAANKAGKIDIKQKRSADYLRRLQQEVALKASKRKLPDLSNEFNKQNQ